MPFVFRANGCGVIHIGGHRYLFTLATSNLGRGSLRYFVCPFTGRHTRTLYRPHQRLPFGHRCAFRPVIGYASQLAGRNYFLQRSFQISDKADRLAEEISRWKHAGKPTRRARQLEAMKEQANVYSMYAFVTSPFYRKFALAISQQDDLR